MKAATLSKQCRSGPRGTVAGAARRHQDGSHAPWRRRASAFEFADGAARAPLPTQLQAQLQVQLQGLAPRAGASTQQAAAAGSASSYGDSGALKVPRVLLIDSDAGTALALASLLMPEASVTHVATLAEARQLLQNNLFSLVVLDPGLSDGDGSSLLPVLAHTPLLVYSARQPEWREPARPYLPKPWTSPRQLWSTISTMLGIAPGLTAGD